MPFVSCMLLECVCGILKVREMNLEIKQPRLVVRCWGGIISRRARIRRQRKCVCSSGKKKIVQCLLKGEHAGFIRWAALLRVRARA